MPNRHFKFYLCFLLLGSLYSDYSFALTYSANQLVELAIKNSSLLSAYELETQAKEKISEQAGAWDNPNFAVASEVKEEAGGETKSTKFELSQTLYRPGKFSTKKKYFAVEADLARIQASTNQLELRHHVFKLIFEYKVAKEKLSHVDERLDRFKTAEAYLKSRVIVAPQRKAEASIVTAKLIVLQKEQLHIQAQKENIWQDLNFYLHFENEPEINAPWYQKAPLISKAEVYDELAVNSSELKIQDAKILQSEVQGEMLRHDRWPGVSISGSYSNGTGFSPEKIYGVGLSIPLPILNTNSSGRAAAGLQLQSEQLKRKYINEEVNKKLNLAYFNYEVARKLITQLPVKKIKDFEKEIRQTDKSFKRGQVDLLTYLEADSQHFESLSAILDSQIELIKSISEIQILIGQYNLNELKTGK